MDSVKEPALHVSLIWSGVAKLFIKFHVFWRTLQCYFVALQFFAEESQCWYQPKKQTKQDVQTFTFDTDTLKGNTVFLNQLSVFKTQTHSFPSCFPLHTSLTTTSSTRPLCQDKKKLYNVYFEHMHYENTYLKCIKSTFAQAWMNLCSMISVAVATICPRFVSSTTMT